MIPLERVSTTLQHKEPDKVPLFLFFTVHGASFLNSSYPDYYTSPELVAEGQLRLQEKFGHDCLYPFFYAGVECAAFGGDVIYRANGPPESGRPPFKTIEDLLAYELPDPTDEVFEKVVQAQNICFKQVGDTLPILNSVIAPLALPIMLLGFETWIEMIVTQPELVRSVVEHLGSYTIDLANYLLENSATAIAYFNPLASTQMLRLEEFQELSLEVCRSFFNKIRGPAVYALAGGAVEPLMETITSLKVPGVVVSRKDDLSKLKELYGNKMVLVGNLNNIEMAFWDDAKTESEVRRCVAEAAAGGGFIIADQHGDLPFNVPDSVLHKLVTSRDKWATY